MKDCIANDFCFSQYLEEILRRSRGSRRRYRGYGKFQEEKNDVIGSNVSSRNI